MTVADRIIVVIALLAVSFSFYLTWQPATPGETVSIYQGDHLYQRHSIHEHVTLHVPGKLGDSVIQIENGHARFEDSPCQSKFCVHSGWLQQSGDIIACLPNGISLQISGGNARLDAVLF